jgi:NADH dehydrogenase
VYVAGDAAEVFDFTRGKPVPWTAQLAVQEGEVVARNIAASLEDRPLTEFQAWPLGEALSLGGTDAVAEVAGLVLSGRPAAMVKRAALLRYLRSLGGPRLIARYS